VVAGDAVGGTVQAKSLGMLNDDINLCFILGLIE
jgi:hypothetical protein